MWIIEDWTGKRVSPHLTFDTFEDARERISLLAEAEAGGADSEERAEEIYNGMLEDLYAVEVTTHIARFAVKPTERRRPPAKSAHRPARPHATTRE